MEVLTHERIATLLGFLAILLLAWFAVYLRMGHKPGDTRANAAMEAQLEVSSVKALGGGTRAILMQAAGTNVLVITHNKTTAQVITLGAHEPAGPKA